MRTVVGLGLGLLLLTAGVCAAQEEIFICRSADGAIFMTDNYRAIPPDCRPLVRPPQPKGGLTIVPSEPLSYVPPLWIHLVERMWMTRPLVGVSLYYFRDRALGLVREYQRLQAERLRSHPAVTVPDFPGWRGELAERRTNLLAEMERASIPADERREIERILGLIP